MRLTCPNCDAIYDLPDDQLPAGGSHVQCSACHTRWFARAGSTDTPSEDQIIARLERRAAPPATGDVGTLRVRAPVTRPAGPSTGPIAFPVPHRGGVAEPRPASAEAAPPPAPEVGAQPGVQTPLRPRASADATPATEEGASASAPAATGRRGGAFGFALALAIGAAGVAAYLRAEDLAVRAPVAAPALAGFVRAVDASRLEIEARLGPIRNRVTDAALN